jgi:hypothetical protein
MLTLIASLIIKVGFCCSELVKAKKGGDEGKPLAHAFGIRFVLCLLGLLTILLALMGHVSIRRRRFVPLSLSQQFSYLSSLNWTVYVQAILKVVALRAVLLSANPAATCSSDWSMIIGVIMYILALSVQASLLTLNSLQSSNTKT